MPDWGKWFGRLKKHKVRTPSQRPTPTGDLTTTVGNGLNVALRLLKEAVTGIGVPGLEAAVNGVVGVIDLIKDVRDNANDLGDLNGLILSLAKAISRSPDLHLEEDVTESLRLRIDAFLSELHGMLMEVQKILGDENLVSRTANSRAHKAAIEDINARINRLLSRFSVEGILSIELDLAGARRDIRSVDKTQKALVTAQVAQEYENLINAIPRVHARYDDTTTKPSRPCHPGTRIDLLQTIRAWIYGGLDTTPYFWLCGEVGVGKTTVAHTIAQESEALHQLGASFFFSRHDDNRRTPHLLFTSIAYQLARFDPRILQALAETLKPDPDIVKKTPKEQFKQLILQPLARSGIDSSETVIIVIDGLDECSDPALVLDILTLGIDNVGVRLRVLISSRPYAAILSKFEDTRLCHLTSETKFRDIDPVILSKDVAAYLSWSLGDLASRRRLPSPWPPKAQLDELIERAAGLIIIASTYTKYIDDPEVGNPTDQLARILSRRRRIGSSPLAELDSLYDQVLGDLMSKLPSEVVIARDVITLIILGKGDINVQILSGLLCYDSSDVRLVIRHLTAVIPLPENDANAIVPFHASFGEYIQDSTRCAVRELSVEAQAAYGRIAVQCSVAAAPAVKEGIMGVEYDTARGRPYLPVHLNHIAINLPFYLSRSPPAQVEEVKRNIIGTGIWVVFRLIMSAGWKTTYILELIDALGGLEGLPYAKGTSDNARAAELMGMSILVNEISEIRRMAEKTAIAREKVELVEASQRRTLKFVKTNIDYDGAETALSVLRNVRCWMKYNHRNILSFKDIDVTFGDENVPQEVLVFVASPSPVSIQRSASLHEYLKKNDNLDSLSRIQIALSVADALRYLHGSSPPQPHNGAGLHQIMMSDEGQPLLYPSRWDLQFQSRPLPSEDDVDENTCGWKWDFLHPGWSHWYPAGENEWEVSNDARLQVDVWDFGSILYQITTGEEPSTIHKRLANRNEAFDTSYTGDWEAAVLLLLNTLHATQDVKELLKSCWTIRMQDRPPMSEVFERLKAIVDTMET